MSKRRHLPDVLEEHVEEAAFLAARLRASMFDSDLTSSDAQSLSSRIAGHLEGVLAVQHAATALLLSYLDGDDADQAATAAVGLMTMGDPTAQQACCNRIATAPPEIAGTIAVDVLSATATGRIPWADPPISGDQPRLVALRLAMHAVTGRPVDPAALMTALHAEDSVAAFLAWRATMGASAT